MQFQSEYNQAGLDALEAAGLFKIPVMLLQGIYKPLFLVILKQ